MLGGSESKRALDVGLTAKGSSYMFFVGGLPFQEVLRVGVGDAIIPDHVWKSGVWHHVKKR